MNDVDVRQILTRPDQFSTGLCNDVHARLTADNAGQSPRTAKYKPWKLVSFPWLERPEAASAFERYFKTGSGRAFANKRLC